MKRTALYSRNGMTAVPDKSSLGTLSIWWHCRPGAQVQRAAVHPDGPGRRPRSGSTPVDDRRQAFSTFMCGSHHRHPSLYVPGHPRSCHATCGLLSAPPSASLVGLRPIHGRSAAASTAAGGRACNSSVGAPLPARATAVASSQGVRRLPWPAGGQHLHRAAASTAANCRACSSSPRRSSRRRVAGHADH